MQVRIYILLGLAAVGTAEAMVDNRYFIPLLGRHPTLSADGVSSYVNFEPFVLGADRSYNKFRQEQPLFEYGEEERYLLRKLDDALVALGTIPSSLLRSDWRTALLSGPYLMEGNMNARGVAFGLSSPVHRCVELGFRGFLMGVSTQMRLLRETAVFDGVIAGPGDEFELIQLQNQIHHALGINSLAWNRAGFGDTEFYARLFAYREYEYRCRSVEGGVAFGIVAPTGVTRDVNNPASIPFGGNGHWGVFIEGNADAVVRHELRAGIWARFQQRFKKTQLQRVPLMREALGFGAIVGPFTVKPGLTFMLAPHISFEHMRDGLGIHLGYTMVTHLRDEWVDCRTNTSSGFNADTVSKESAWGSEQLWCSLFYDFRQRVSMHESAPILGLNVSFPLNWTVAARSFQTLGVSISVESYF